MVSVEPKSMVRGWRKNKPNTRIRTPHRAAEKKPVAASCSARFFSWCPSSRDMLFPAPWPKKKPQA